MSECILKTAKQCGSSINFIVLMFVRYKGTTESEVYNIYDFAMVRFRKQYENNHYISMKKHEAAKYLRIKIALNDYEIICSEDWSEWKSCTNEGGGRLFNVKITVIVSKVESIKAKLYEDSDFTDFQLNAPDGSVAVHKTFLAAHSDVFKTMLHGDWKETAEGCIELEGVTLQTLQHLKDYMYLDTLPNDGLQPLLLLARRYLIESLEKECIMKLMQTVKAKNLYNLLEFAMANDIHKLVHNILQKTPDEILIDALKIKMEKQICIADDKK